MSPKVRPALTLRVGSYLKDRRARPKRASIVASSPLDETSAELDLLPELASSTSSLSSLEVEPQTPDALEEAEEIPLEQPSRFETFEVFPALKKVRTDKVRYGKRAVAFTCGPYGKLSARDSWLRSMSSSSETWRRKKVQEMALWRKRAFERVDLVERGVKVIPKEWVRKGTTGYTYEFPTPELEAAWLASKRDLAVCKERVATLAKEVRMVEEGLKRKTGFKGKTWTEIRAEEASKLQVRRRMERQAFIKESSLRSKQTLDHSTPASAQDPSLNMSDDQKDCNTDIASDGLVNALWKHDTAQSMVKASPDPVAETVKVKRASLPRTVLKTLAVTVGPQISAASELLTTRANTVSSISALDLLIFTPSFCFLLLQTPRSFGLGLSFIAYMKALNHHFALAPAEQSAHRITFFTHSAILAVLTFLAGSLNVGSALGLFRSFALLVIWLQIVEFLGKRFCINKA